MVAPVLIRLPDVSALDGYTQFGMASEKGFMTVGKEGNAYVREDITAEQIKNGTVYLQAIFDWIKKNCDVIPCEEALKINTGQRQKLYDLFGSDAIDSVLLAKQEKRIFVTDDERL